MLLQTVMYKYLAMHVGRGAEPPCPFGVHHSPNLPMFTDWKAFRTLSF